MDDFRIDSVSPYASYEEQKPADGRQRRKPRRDTPPDNSLDDVLLHSGNSDGAAEDSYSPADPARDPR